MTAKTSRKPTSLVPSQRRSVQPWLVCLILLLLPWHLDAYRVGDTIDTEILTPKDSTAQHAPKRKQMPVFGVDTSAQFGPMTGIDRFSIHFEEGFRALPWVSTKNFHGAFLEKVKITFIFSRSGGGEIHSLTSASTYYTDRKAPPPENGEITVEYEWIEEEAVDFNGGAFVMFLIVFVSSLFILVDLCGMCDHGSDLSDPYYGGEMDSTTNNNNHNNSYSDRRQVDPMALMSGSRIPKYE